MRTEKLQREIQVKTTKRFNYLKTVFLAFSNNSLLAGTLIYCMISVTLLKSISHTTFHSPKTYESIGNLSKNLGKTQYAKYNRWLGLNQVIEGYSFKTVIIIFL